MPTKAQLEIELAISQAFDDHLDLAARRLGGCSGQKGISGYPGTTKWTDNKNKK
jgi:hypothetical protein